MNVVYSLHLGMLVSKGAPQKSLGIWVPLAVGMAPLALVRDDAGGSVMKLGNAFAFARFKTQLD